MARLYIGSTEIVLNRRHIIFTMSENFAIKIDSLQHLEICKKNLACEPAKNPRYNIHCFDVMLIFPLMPTIFGHLYWVWQKDFPQRVRSSKVAAFTCCNSTDKTYF